MSEERYKQALIVVANYLDDGSMEAMLKPMSATSVMKIVEFIFCVVEDGLDIEDAINKANGEGQM